MCKTLGEAYKIIEESFDKDGKYSNRDVKYIKVGIDIVCEYCNATLAVIRKTENKY